MTEKNFQRLCVFGWIGTTLFFSYFHEPWRDEAQAWLVARYSETLTDLLMRASIEASGPIYYLILWPFARIFSSSFPIAIFLPSWTGTFLAVLTWVYGFKAPRLLKVLVLFGYLLGAEYALVSRLYGWGLFFLLLGISKDLNHKQVAAWVSLALCCFVQLNFTFAVAGWCCYRFVTTKERYFYTSIAIAALMSLVHLFSYSSMWPWVPPGLNGISWNGIGSTIASGFLQSPGKVGWAGIFILPLIFAPLNLRQRISFLVGFLPFLYLFSIRYAGAAKTRHAGPLFFLWLVFIIINEFGQTGSEVPKKWTRKILFCVLSLGFISGLHLRGWDFFRNYSDGIPAAKSIKENTIRPNRRVYVLSWVTFPVIAAGLDEVVWVGNLPMGCPFGPQNCPPPKYGFEKMDEEFKSAGCGEKISCFAVGSPLELEPLKQKNGVWRQIFNKTPTIVVDEAFEVLKFEKDVRS